METWVVAFCRLRASTPLGDFKVQFDMQSTGGHRFPTGSIVLIKEPTHDFWNYTSDILGFVYETYVEKGVDMYAVLMQKRRDLYDMKHFRKSTENLSKDICCQLLEAHRLATVPIDP